VADPATSPGPVGMYRRTGRDSFPEPAISALNAILAIRKAGLAARGQVDREFLQTVERPADYLLRRWAEQLQEGGGALLLAGVGQKMGDQLERTGIARLLGHENIFPAHSLVYRSTVEAFAAGRLQLERDKGEHR